MMTLNQIMTAIRAQTFVELPDGRTGFIADVGDYDWRNSEVVVTLENGERVRTSQHGDLKTAFYDAAPNPFAAHAARWKGGIERHLRTLSPDEPKP